MSSTKQGHRAVRIVVSGRVQGVSFRYFTRQEARRLGLVGWVRNLATGEVEVRVAGEPAVLEEFRQRLWQGPPASRVDNLDESELMAGDDWQEFEITY